MSYDLMNAEAYARSAPGFLKTARERGDARTVAEQERRIAWANGILAQHGKPSIPVDAATSTPAPGTAAQRLAPPAAPAQPPAAAAPSWDNTIAHINSTAPATATAPPAGAPTTAAAWDGVVSNLNRLCGLGPAPEAAVPPHPTPDANHGWDGIMAKVTAEGGKAAGPAGEAWADVMAEVNGEQHHGG